jgi:hypothetical protein
MMQPLYCAAAARRTKLLCASPVEINQVDRRILPAQKKIHHFLVMCGVSRQAGERQK